MAQITHESIWQISDDALQICIQMKVEADFKPHWWHTWHTPCFLLSYLPALPCALSALTPQTEPLGHSASNIVMTRFVPSNVYNVQYKVREYDLRCFFVHQV
jgi:hypothetical protein